MPDTIQKEQLLNAWISLSGILKNSRITTGLLYNEAIVMNILYHQFLEDGEGVVSIKEITQRTKMLKSLVNRTVNALEEKGFLERCTPTGDKRIVHVKCVKENMDGFLQVHKASLSHAQRIIDIIGKEDADAFIRIVQKIEESGYHL